MNKSSGNKKFVPHEIRIMPLSALKDHPKNPRTIRDTALKGLAASIEEFGLIEPIIWNKRSGHIVGGHQRRKALLANGYTEAQVIIVDFDEKKEIGALLSLNNDNIQGEYTDAAYDLAYSYEEAFPDNARALMLHDLKLDFAPKILDAAERAPFYSQDQVIDAAFAYYRAKGFPYQRLEKHVAMQQINKLSSLSGEASIRTNLAYHVADTYHPHRYEGKVSGKKSLIEYFADDEWLRIAIKNQLELQGSIGMEYFSFLGMTRGSQVPQNFRPGFAMYLYRKYGKPGGVVLDPCTGYGGRLVGWWASQLGGEYVGVDPNNYTCASNERMTQALGIKGVTIIEKPFEDTQPALSHRFGCVDFAFTSPPYFSKEHYSECDTQSWVRYKTIEAWTELFLKKMFNITAFCLKKGAHFAVNITDVNIGSKTYPLEDLTVICAQKAGLTLTETLRFKLPTLPGNNTENINATEPVFVFQKK